MASPLSFPASPLSGEDARSVGQESCDSNTNNTSSSSAQTLSFSNSDVSTAQRLFDARQQLKQLQTQLTEALRQQAATQLTELTSEMDAYVNLIARLEQQDREESEKRSGLRNQLRSLQQRSHRKRDEVDTFHMIISGHVLGETKEPFTRAKAVKTVDQIRKMQWEIDRDIETLDGLPPRSSGLYTPQMATDKKATIQLLQLISADLEQTNQFATNFINSFDTWIGKVSPQNRLRQQDNSPSNGSGDDSGTGADTENADGDEIFADDEEPEIEEEEQQEEEEDGVMDEAPVIADFDEDEDM